MIPYKNYIISNQNLIYIKVQNRVTCFLSLECLLIRVVVICFYVFSRLGKEVSGGDKLQTFYRKFK